MLTSDKTVAYRVKKILVVDDDLRFVKLIKDNLRDEGYSVLCGFDGTMAVELAQSQRPDVILLDVNMPYMDGLKAFERLRANEVTSRIPVIFVSEMTSQTIYPVVESSQRVAHLKKPIDLVDLTSFLRQFIQRYEA